jgi:hypothetical protein
MLLIQLFLFNADVLKAFIEFADLSARIYEAMDTRPGWMRLWVDFKTQGIALFAPCGHHRAFRTISHNDLDFVIVGVDTFFHNVNFSSYSAITPNLSNEFPSNWQEVYSQAFDSRSVKHSTAGMFQ